MLISLQHMEGPCRSVYKRHYDIQQKREESKKRRKREAGYYRCYREIQKKELSLLQDELILLRQKCKKLEKKSKEAQQKLVSFINSSSIQHEGEENDSKIEYEEIIAPDLIIDRLSQDEVQTYVLKAKEWINQLLTTHKDRMKDMINIDSPTFEKVWKKIEHVLAGLNARGEPRRYLSFKESHFSDREQFVICCAWMATFLPWPKFTYILGYHDPRYLARIVHRVLCSFSIVHDEVVKMLPDDEVIKLLATDWVSYFDGDHAAWNNMAYVVDGSSFDVPRPSGLSVDSKVIAAMKPPHKKRFVVNVLFLVLLDGRYAKCSTTFNGSHDQRDWNRCGWRNLFINKDYGVGGDGEFTFNLKGCRQAIIGNTPPKKLPHQLSLSDEQLLRHARFAQLRVVVENAIGRLKSWACLFQKYRYYSLSRKPVCSLEYCIRACMVVEQIKMEDHPIRPPGWAPKKVQLVKHVDPQTGVSRRKLVFKNPVTDAIITSSEWD